MTRRAGYEYSFPFLPGGVLEVGDHAVRPLWHHLYPVSVAPSLALVGLPWKTVPFPQFEVQARLVARVLSGRVELPSQKQLAREVEEQEAARRASGEPRRYAHRFTGDGQWEYNDHIAELAASEERGGMGALVPGVPPRTPGGEL